MLLDILKKPFLAPRKKPTVRELIQRESAIGGTLFGHVPINRRREFFCLDARTWVWHEEWQDVNGAHAVTTRYEVHGDTILKLQDDVPAELVHGQELTNLYTAIKAYYYAVARDVYGRPIEG